MDIPEKDIEDFTAIWERDFGYALSRDEARAKANLLVDFYLRLCRPLPSEGGSADLDPTKP